MQQTTYNRQVQTTEFTFEGAKSQDVTYLQKQIGIFAKAKETIQNIEDTNFGSPLKTYAIYHLDAMRQAFINRKQAISDASDSSVYQRLNITSQFDSNREVYYLYRIAPLAKNMYSYSWRDILREQINKYVSEEPFTGSKDEIQTKAELAYDASVYKRYIPASLSDKNFDSQAMIAKYHTFLMQQALQDSHSSSLQKTLRPQVDAVRADSLTLAFDTKYSSKAFLSVAWSRRCLAHSSHSTAWRTTAKKTAKRLKLLKHCLKNTLRPITTHLFLQK